MSNVQLPLEALEKIFSNLSFKESKDFGNEKYWKNRCLDSFGLSKKLFNRSWKTTLRYTNVYTKIL